MLTFNNVSLAEDDKCQTALQKLKPSCNIIGKGAKKLKQLSEENKTINQTYENIKKKLEKK